jgi:UMF1 family MFS transporter
MKKTGIMKTGVADLKDTFREIRRYRQIIRLLVARMIYNDGLVTIFAFGGIYAAGTFGFSFQEIMIFGIVLNVAAGTGALIMGVFDDRLGGKTTIQVSNGVLTLAVLMAVLAPDKAMFWVAGILVGFFAGPNQSASRSLLGRFVPEEKENQFYGFFAFSGKLTAFMGPLLLGVLTRAFDSQRAGVAVVMLFFVAGGLLLSRVDEQEGKAAARRES